MQYYSMAIDKYLSIRFIWLLVIHIVKVQTSRPTSKQKLSVWQLECKLGVIADPECPIDGGWSPWSTWTPCKGSCDDIGHRRRTRECTNPPPSQDGALCAGAEEQTDLCYLTNCTVADYRNLIHGDSARMKALHQLEAVPALMERCLQMDCPFEAIEGVLTADNTWQLNSESLWNALQCVKRNLGCPIAGEWGPWGAWSTCGARCGQGMKWRSRKCDTPPPSDANFVCSGTPLQIVACIGDQCAIGANDSGGHWGEWSSWSACSEECGPGIHGRRRICREATTPRIYSTWGTDCRGQHDQFEVCENSMCNLDGGWSVWSGWGPCSQNCGAGKRSRTRSCTRPIPAGEGKFCVGPRTEIGSCHLAPCEGFSHKVALFHGESSLYFAFPNKRAVLYHFYMRFMPLSPHGTLVLRRAGDDSYVRLSLQKWHVCLDGCGAGHSCCLSRSCSDFIVEPETWHSALVTVTNEDALLRLDDSLVGSRSIWTCTPDLPDNNLNIYVGDKFQGQIQELIFNFIPLKMSVNKDPRTKNTDFYPVAASNVAYEKASTTEGFLEISNDYYVRLPCYENQDEWTLELTLKPEKEAGTILFLKNDQNDNWLHLDLQNMRLKLKLVLGDFRSESSSTAECPPDSWLDITLTKILETNAIEASVNGGERLHVLFEEEVARRRGEYTETGNRKISNAANNGWTNETGGSSETLALCTDEFFIGGVPHEIKQAIKENFVAFSGVLASVRLNKEFIDLHDYSLERYKDSAVQVSSRTASISGSYHETAWGRSNRLNLTCLHARTARSPHAASWLYLDTAVVRASRDKSLRSIDDGRVLRLVATADNNLKGFYTCRAHSNRYTRNIVTYGVMGKIQYKLHGPDMITVLAVVTTIGLVLGTLMWLFLEGIHDLRNGYGFFRDAHLSPEQEAEAVCKYIDQNIHLIQTDNGAQLAKAKARRKAKHLVANRSDFAAQEPQGLIEVNLELGNRLDISLSEPETLPALPEINNEPEQIHDVYRFEVCYLSSPRHRSLTSPYTKVTSTSSFELVSPRVLCSKLLMSKGWRSLKATSKKNDKVRSLGKPLTKASTATSSGCARHPAHKILRKFEALKSDD